MAIMDERTEFADAASVAGEAGTALIGDQIPLSYARDIGNGQPIYLCITCSTGIITGGNAGTIRFQLASDASASIATNGTATVHFDTGTFVTDGDDANEIDAGDVIACVPLPLEGLRSYEGFLGILCTIATTTVTAGAINAWLSLTPIGNKFYPEGAN
jgi:hypothetical protein